MMPEDHAFSLFERVNNYLLLLYACACLLMNFSLAGLLYIRGNIVLSLMLPGILAVILPLFVLSRRFSLNFFEEYRLEAPDTRTAALSLLVCGAAIIPIETLTGYLERSWPPEADYINFLLAIKPKGAASFITLALGLVVVAPVVEELLFRGFVQRIFQRNMVKVLAVALAAIVFGLSHFNLFILPGVAAIGALFGYLFVRTGNLIYPIMGHSLFNLVSFVRLHLTPAEEISASEASATGTGWIIISAAVLAVGIGLLEQAGSSAEIED